MRESKDGFQDFFPEQQMVPPFAKIWKTRGGIGLQMGHTKLYFRCVEYELDGDAEQEIRYVSLWFSGMVRTGLEDKFENHQHIDIKTYPHQNHVCK